MQMTYGNTVKLKYFGPTDFKPSRIQASWEGWPSDDCRTIRKTISRNYEWQDSEYVQWAVNQFVAWLQTGPLGDKLTCSPVQVTQGRLDGSTDVLLIKTEWKES